MCLVQIDPRNPQVKQRVFRGEETLAKLLILNGLLKLPVTGISVSGRIALGHQDWRRNRPGAPCWPETTETRRVHRWPAPRCVRVWALCATRGGNGWLWYAMGLIVLLFGGAERFRAVEAAALAAGTGVAAFLRLKKAAGRRRPCALEPHCWSTVLPPDQFSFPSGHTVTAFAVAASLSLCYPGLALGLLLCAASVAISRVLLGIHFLSDVVASAIIGTVLAGTSAWTFGLL